MVEKEEVIRKIANDVLKDNIKHITILPYGVKTVAFVSDKYGTTAIRLNGDGKCDKQYQIPGIIVVSGKVHGNDIMLSGALVDEIGNTEALQVMRMDEDMYNTKYYTLPQAGYCFINHIHINADKSLVILGKEIKRSRSDAFITVLSPDFLPTKITSFGTKGVSLYRCSTDADDNIICCGKEYEEGLSNPISVKLDKNLHEIERKIYHVPGQATFNNIIFQDINDPMSLIWFSGFIVSSIGDICENLTIVTDHKLNRIETPEYWSRGDVIGKKNIIDYDLINVRKENG